MGSFSQGSTASRNLLKCKFLDWRRNIPALMGGGQCEVKRQLAPTEAQEIAFKFKKMFSLKEWSGTGPGFPVR